MGHPVLRARAALDPRDIKSPRCSNSSTTCSRRCRNTRVSAWPRRRCTRASACSSPASRRDEDEHRRRGRRRRTGPADGPDQSRDHAVGDDTVEDWEGCLSIPDIRGRVPRAREIKVKAYDRRAGGSRCARRLHRARDPARDRSPRRRAVLRPDGVVRNADVPGRVQQVLEPREVGRGIKIESAISCRFRSSSRSALSRSSSTSNDRRTASRGDRAMAGLIARSAVHLLADAAVGGVSLRRRAQLDDVHRFARVHVHVEADAVGHRDRVRRGGGEPAAAEPSYSSAEASITRVQSSSAPASRSRRARCSRDAVESGCHSSVSSR